LRVAAFIWQDEIDLYGLDQEKEGGLKDKHKAGYNSSRLACEDSSVNDALQPIRSQLILLPLDENGSFCGKDRRARHLRLDWLLVVRHDQIGMMGQVRKDRKRKIAGTREKQKKMPALT
jgi:hypothetical protein